jgi:hypothetical protein
VHVHVPASGQLLLITIARCVQGTIADKGRFVLLPVSTYPALKEADRDGKAHVGWSVKISQLGARGRTLWLAEKGGSPTGFPLAEARALALLSV